MDELEQFQLPDGTMVATGNLVPDNLPRLYADFPESKLLDDSDIEKLFKQRYYKQDRIKHGKYMINQSSVGKCFPAGTLIRMADGSQKPIEDVQTLDEVLTAEGNIKPVLATMVREYVGKVTRVCVWGNRHIRCTPEHPFLTKRGYVEAKDLTSDDWVAIPRFAPQTTDTIYPWEIMAKPIGFKKERRLQAEGKVTRKIPGKSESTEHRVPVPEEIDLDYDFGWLLGIFLAEGSLNYSKIQFCLAKHEEHTHAQTIIDILKDKFEIEATKVIRNNECQIKLYGSNWTNLLFELCSYGCAGKQLHPALTSANKECLEGILQGWMDGDGLGSVDSWGGVTVSHSLAINMYNIAIFLGHAARIETLDVKINPRHKIKKRQTRYIVKWQKNPVGEQSPRYEVTDAYLWRRVDKIEFEDFDNYVFNFEVKDDHSYVAEGIGVHNCNASAAVGGLYQIGEQTGQKHVALADNYLYMNINGGRDVGSLLHHGMEFIKNSGCAPRVLPSGQIGHLVYNKSQVNRQVLQEADQEASRFKVWEPYQIPTDYAGFVRTIATCLARGYPIVMAWHVSNASMRLNNGYVVQGNGPGNHATLFHSAKWVGGKDLVHPDLKNSWGPTQDELYGPKGASWGEAGYGLLTMQSAFQCRKYHDFYVLTGAIEDPKNSL